MKQKRYLLYFFIFSILNSSCSTKPPLNPLRSLEVACPQSSNKQIYYFHFRLSPRWQKLANFQKAELTNPEEWLSQLPPGNSILLIALENDIHGQPYKSLMVLQESSPGSFAQQYLRYQQSLQNHGASQLVGPAQTIQVGRASGLISSTYSENSYQIVFTCDSGPGLDEETRKNIATHFIYKIKGRSKLSEQQIAEFYRDSLQELSSLSYK